MIFDLYTGQSFVFNFSAQSWQKGWPHGINAVFLKLDTHIWHIFFSSLSMLDSLFSTSSLTSGISIKLLLRSLSFYFILGRIGLLTLEEF